MNVDKRLLTEAPDKGGGGAPSPEGASNGDKGGKGAPSPEGASNGDKGGKGAPSPEGSANGGKGGGGSPNQEGASNSGGSENADRSGGDPLNSSRANNADNGGTGTRRPPDQMVDEFRGKKIGVSLEDSLSDCNRLLGVNSDFLVRRFDIFGRHSAALLFFSDLTDATAVNMNVLRPLMYPPPHLAETEIPVDGLHEVLVRQVLFYSECRVESAWSEVFESVMRGQVVLLADGMEHAVLLDSKKVDKRSIEQPQTEQVIQGPREGFIEQLSENLALIRYRLPTTDLRIETMEIGRLTKSKVAVCYVEGIVNPALVDEVRKRLDAIEIDAILDAGYLEQFIEDDHLSPFPQIQSTERPDKAVANLVEGRALVLVEGSPFALIAPTVFSQFYQTSEDYNSRFLQGSFVRLARLVALVFSLIFPSLYVAIISYNPELIPTEFAVAVAGGRAGVPFPSFLEVFVMEISMEVLREATIRLPQQVGGALSIVGVLVVGQAAVSAGFASPITVVVIALTTIGSFATPAYNAAFALRMLRFPLVALSGMFGLYGVVVGLILICNHLLSLKSFGVPYLTPAVPGNFQGMKDLVFRSPFWKMYKRPEHLSTLNDTRVGKEATGSKRSPDTTNNKDSVE